MIASLVIGVMVVVFFLNNHKRCCSFRFPALGKKVVQVLWTVVQLQAFEGFVLGSEREGQQTQLTHLTKKKTCWLAILHHAGDQNKTISRRGSRILVRGGPVEF